MDGPVRPTTQRTMNVHHLSWYNVDPDGHIVSYLVSRGHGVAQARIKAASPRDVIVECLFDPDCFVPNEAPEGRSASHSP